MYKRIIVVILLILMKRTLCLDSRCKHSNLKNWNEKVDAIEMGMKAININESRTSVRKVPFCIGMEANSIEPKIKMRRYLPIFADIILKENNSDYVVGLSTHKDGRSPQGFVKNISFSRITVPEKSMTNLRQWVHIMFSADSIEGLIVQPICMPLGLPCGQFKLQQSDIDCIDCLYRGVNTHVSLDVRIGFRSPCLYRPRASVIHPQAWVFSGNALQGNNLHTNFVWIDALCQEMLSVQFLILAVKNFTSKSYEVFYSPVYSNQQQDSKEGSPYLWSTAAFGRKTQCHGGEQNCIGCKHSDPLKLGVNRKTGVLLRYNKEYDDCIKNKQGKDNECPPGPFKCYMDRNLAAISAKSTGITLGNTLEKYRDGLIPHMMGCPRTRTCKDANEQRNKVCIDAILERKTLIAGDEEDSLERKYVLPMYEELLTSSVLLHRESAGISGAGSCLGMGWWLWSHILLSFLSLGVIWMGMSSIAFRPKQPYSCKVLVNYTFEVVLNETDSDVLTELEKYCEKEETLRALHILFGVLTIVIIYVEVIIGWVRPMVKNLRTCSVTVHVYLGYFAPILAIISVYFSNACYDIKLIATGILAVNMIFIFGVTFLQKYLDRKANRKRAFCPVPEAKEINRCGILITMLTIGQCVLSIILYFLITLSYTWQRGIQEVNMNKIFFSEAWGLNTSNPCPLYGAGIVVGAIRSELWK